ncbi:MAG: hypothetical protein V4714_03220 [Bacteroidota bacterium]
MKIFGNPSPYKPDYGKPVAYLGGDNKIRPINRPPCEGFFSAYPSSLAIDQYTGEIDLSKSNTGVRYTIVFTDCDKRESSARLIISGIDYDSRIFSLSSTKQEEYIAKPFYNAHPKNWEYKGKFNIIPKEPKPTADLQGLVIDPDTGQVDLKATILNGALGFGDKTNAQGQRLPANGASKEFKIYYELEDDSKNALNYTPFVIHFFNTREDIPKDLIDKVDHRRTAFKSRLTEAVNKSLPVFLLATPVGIFSNTTWGLIVTTVASLATFFFQTTQTGKKRDDPDKPPEHMATS